MNTSVSPRNPSPEKCVPGSMTEIENLASAEDVLRFHRDGFVIIRDVLPAAEVTTLRAGIERFAAAARARGHVFKPVTGEIIPCGDFLGQPDIGWLISDRRIVAIARRLLATDQVVYFGDGGVMVGGHQRGFHKDNTVRDTADHSDWQSPYTLLRMGLYLEDHVRHSGGLKVRRTSHLHADVTSGPIVDVPTRAGDVVVWSLRTTHSGHAVRVRGLPFLRLSPRVEVRFPRVLHAPEERRRVAAFITFARDDHHLRSYVSKHTDLAAYPDNYMYKSWLYSDGGEGVSRRLAASGVTFLKPIAEYGKHFGSSEPTQDGYVQTRPPRPDVYPAHGLEAWIRRAGKLLRAVGMS